MEILNGEGRDRAARATGENVPAQTTAQTPASRPAGRTAGTAALAKSVTLMSGIVAILGAGGVIAGAAGLISAGVLVLIGIPVAGFTRNQWMATSKGLQFVESVADVEALKRSDAFAFAQPIAAIRRRPPGEDGDTPVAEETDTQEQYSLLEMAGQGVLGPAGSAPPPGAAPAIRAGTASRWAADAQKTFWDSLTCAERARLVETARTVEFPPEAVVWHRGEVADHVILIQAGYTRIYGGPAGGERIIAVRGPGDLIGERAALHRSSRSATVVTTKAVRGLFITTEQFRELVSDHPDLLGAMEEQVYRRLSGAADRRCSCEPRAGRAHSGAGDDGGDGDGDGGDGEGGDPGAAGSGGLASLTAGVPSGGWVGQNCSVVFTDIAAYGSHVRSEEDRRTVRRVMYKALREAFEGSGVSWSACHREDRGDGVL
ncbi:cyclic nucleotide-binding domain-containing protein, partial [Actinomadura sp. GC306]|uniref:cyclic nucleotide-binding domain-containing protein n=1 Tax=Actinomadura sp. GC306 TaxID=2530367 RepID=UPI00104D64FB